MLRALESIRQNYHRSEQHLKHFLLNRDFGVVRTVAVFGPGRGGTSVIAGCLRALGVCMGTSAHAFKHEWSPIVRRPDDKVDVPATQQNIQEMNANHVWWGWKFPSDVFHIESVTAFLRHPGFIVVTRDLTEIALSSLARQDVPFEISLYEAAKVSRRIAERMLFWPWPILVIPFAEALRHPSSLVEALCSFLQMNPSEATRKQAAEFVQPLTQGYRPFDAKPDQLHDFSPAAEIQTDSQVLAMDLSKRYSKDYFQQFEGLLTKAKATTDDLAARIERAGEFQIASDILNELRDLFGTFELAQAGKNSIIPRMTDSCSAEQWRAMVNAELDQLATAAQTASQEALQSKGGYDALNRVYRALQLLIRARTTLKASLHRLKALSKTS